MKKILILNGSFRKGNTDKTLEPIRKVIRKKSDVELREFMIRDLIDTTCFGCAICVTKGKEFCPTYDNEKRFIENIEWCDALIIASPVYNGRETYIVKAMFDKFACYVHRPCFFEKKAMVMVTRGGMFREARKYITKVLGQWGFDVTVNCGEPELPVLKEHLIPKTEKKIEQKAEAFYLSLNRKKSIPGIVMKIWFEVWKINAEMGKGYNEADYEYWKAKGWFNQPYYYDTWINPFASILSVILKPIIKGQMRKTFKGY